MISMDKKYKTRDGKDVRILCVDLNTTDFPVLFVVNHLIRVCSSDGQWHGKGIESQFDLIEVSPFAEFNKNDKVMVRNSYGNRWFKRYFAYEKDGLAYCFANGATSWSETQTRGWEQCRKPTEDELK